MKAVILNTKPENCELILNGEKTIDVRKSKPNLKTPFKCYIYCGKGKLLTKFHRDGELYIVTGKKYQKALAKNENPTLNGKIVGEFICDRIYQYTTTNFNEGVDISDEDMQKMACMTYEELSRYESSASNDFCLSYYGLFGWHISNLIIYDKPKELNDFYKPCNWNYNCGSCHHWDSDNALDCLYDEKITRPPSSWCYTEACECT